MELDFNILQSFGGIEQQRSINNFCLNWPWTIVFIDEQAYSCYWKAVLLNGTKIWNPIEMPIQMIQVWRWIIQIAI